MPGAVGRTNTLALCHATELYILRLAASGLERAVREDPALATAVNLHGGAVAHPAVARTFSLEYLPFAA
jgi:alanine dehydrogenase